MTRGWIAILAVLFCVFSWGVFWAVLDARSLAPVQREVVVREVSNGYVVELRNANNPYPAVERIETTAHDAGKAVMVLLKTKFPQPRWGK